MPDCWNYVDELLPPEGVYVQTIARCIRGGWRVPQVMRWLHGRWQSATDAAVLAAPAYWRLLPDPPGPPLTLTLTGR